MDNSAYRTVIVERTGELPLKFHGRLITEGYADQESTRSYYVRIFRTAGGSFVGQVIYRTEWTTEIEGSTVYTEDSRAALAERLLKHDCLTYFVGYPSGDQFRDKQERLIANLRWRYQGLVSKLLVDLDVAVEQK